MTEKQEVENTLERLRQIKEFCEVSEQTLAVQEYKKIQRSCQAPLDAYGGEQGFIWIVGQKRFKPKKLRERHGTDCDVDSLQACFQGLGHIVKTSFDMTKGELDEEMRRISEDELTNNNYGFFMLILLTHGTSGNIKKITLPSMSKKTSQRMAKSVRKIVQRRVTRDKEPDLGASEYVYDADGQLMLPFEDFVAKFSSTACRTMKNKPKIFMFQACRGNELNQMVDNSFFKRNRTLSNVRSSDATPLSEEEIGIQNQQPDICNYAVVRSTVPYKVAFRDANKGSWLIQEFCDALQRYPDTEFQDLIRFVTDRLAEKAAPGESRQVCEMTSTLRKKFFLNFKRQEKENIPHIDE